MNIRPANALGRGEAFSLMDVTMVLAIVATFAAVAIPRYSASMQRYRADATACRIIADIQLARDRARTTGSSAKITFEPSSDSYTIDGMGHPDRPSEPYRVVLREEPYRADLASTWTPEGPYFIFDGFGLPHSSGVIVIYVGDERREIVVDRSTGEINTR